MKIDLFKSLVAICISALFAYACFEICEYERLRWIIAIGSFLTLGLPLILALGIVSCQERSSTMLKALAWIVLLVELVANGIFVLFEFNIPFYVIVNGLILLVFVLIYNSIYRTKIG